MGDILGGRSCNVKQAIGIRTFCFCLNGGKPFEGILPGPWHDLVYVLQLSHRSRIFWGFFPVFVSSLLFSCGSLYFPILTLRDSFLSCVRFTNKPIKGMLHFFYSVVFISHFLFFLKIFRLSASIIHLLLVSLCPWSVYLTSISRCFPSLVGIGWLEEAGAL